MYNSDFSFFLTETEVSAGLGALLSGITVSNLTSKNSIQRLNGTTDLISELKDKWKITPNLLSRDEILYKYFKDNINSYIEVYSNLECLPKEFVKLAQNDDCLQILLRSVIKQLIGVNVTDELNYEILDLERKLHANKNQKIVYVLVNKVQRFIHKVSTHPLELDKNEMASILSCARLHLNLWNTRELSFDEYYELQFKTYKAIKKEMKKPSKKYVLKGLGFHPKQRFPKMMPLQSYANDVSTAFIKAIYQIPIGKTEQEFASLSYQEMTRA